MSIPTASAKRITPTISLGIRRYETLGASDKKYVWMLEAREHCGCGDLYAQSLVTVEQLRDLKAFAEDAIKTLTAQVEASDD